MNERERIRSHADSVRVEWERRLNEAIESEGTATRIAWQHIFLGQLNALLGDGEAAVRHAEKALETYRLSVDALNYAGLLVQVAHIYVMIGDDDRAIDFLEESLSHPGPTSAAWFCLDPLLDPLRDHPRFQALLKNHE